MLESVGSGVAQPLSPPSTPCHKLLGMPAWPPPPPPPPPPSLARLLLGPRYDGPSCLLPSTLYGISSSTVTWYICAIGSWMRFQVRPRFTDRLVPPSFATIMRSPFRGSIHSSWLSPPGL